MPFGLKTAGNTFCRCVDIVLQPVRDFSSAFVDDVTIGSDNWSQHLHNLRLFLHEVQKSGLTLSLDKCKFAQREVRFFGHVVGSGHHRPDEQKLDTIVTLINVKKLKHSVKDDLIIRQKLQISILLILDAK
jgi:hypothetical protein